MFVHPYEFPSSAQSIINEYFNVQIEHKCKYTSQQEM